MMILSQDEESEDDENESDKMRDDQFEEQKKHWDNWQEDERRGHSRRWGSLSAILKISTQICILE